jgi:hypothetical protein
LWTERSARLPSDYSAAVTTLRLLLTAVLPIVLLPLASAPAQAAPPGNDTPAGAVTLRLGETIQQDTRHATTDRQDAALNAGCGAPATKASVWYRFTPSADRDVILDMSRSDYSGGFMIFEGSPTAATLLGCIGPELAMHVSAGTTYYVMVFSDTEVNGGTLVLSRTAAPAPPRVDLKLAARALAYRGGSARLHGTYFCKHGLGRALVTGRVVQRAGRLKIPADFEKLVRCDGTTRHWSARLTSPIGTYARGRARASARLVACGLLECRHDVVRHRVRLHWAKRPQAAPPVSRVEHPRPQAALLTRRWSAPS